MYVTNINLRKTLLEKSSRSTISILDGTYYSVEIKKNVILNTFQVQHKKKKTKNNRRLL